MTPAAFHPIEQRSKQMTKTTSPDLVEIYLAAEKRLLSANPKSPEYTDIKKAYWASYRVLAASKSKNDPRLLGQRV
jgi:hypothetical protein